MCSNMGELTREEGLLYAVCMEEVANSELLSLIPNAPMVTLTHSMMASPLVKRIYCCKGNPQALWRLHDHTGWQRGKPKKWIINKKYNGGDLTWQRGKPKRKV